MVGTVGTGWNYLVICAVRFDVVDTFKFRTEISEIYLIL